MEKAPPTKRPRYDVAFRAEALRLASESRSTLAAARALNIDPKRLYAWQKAVQQPLPADPTEAAEVRALRQANKRLAQELEILKKAIAIFSTSPTP
jgi:transposase